MSGFGFVACEHIERIEGMRKSAYSRCRKNGGFFDQVIVGLWECAGLCRAVFGSGL